MGIKLFKSLLIVSISLVSALLYTPLNFSEGQVLASEIEIPDEIFFEPLSMPGRIEGTGNYFEIKDSQYLNIVLKSSEEIKVVLESIPRTISINIEASQIAISTNLTFENLEPNKTYFKYQDSYKNEAVFVSDENGSYSGTQDLTQSHHIWLQEIKGTTFIDKDTILDHDITGSVEITASNITLDCNNYTLTGNQAGSGIYLNQKTGITIKDCNVNNFSYQIYLNRSTYNILTGNTLSNSLGEGIYLTNYSLNNTLSFNSVHSNREGIYFTGHAENNILTGNTIALNQWGIIFSYQSSNNNLKNNVLLGNQYNLGFYWWDQPEDFIQDIDTSNTINGKPVYYLVNENNKEISGEAGFVGLVNSSNITAKNLNLVNNVYGVLLVSTQNSRIENIQLSNNYIGVFLLNSLNNNLAQNQIFNNESPLSLTNSPFNIFTNNTIKSNNGPLGFGHSTDNIFYHNNVIDNGQWCGSQAYLRSETGESNIFDNNYPSGGNYWSDYSGIDEKSGPNQDQAGSDGIGDNPYDMRYYYWGNCIKVDQDRYPFMVENGWGGLPPEHEKWSFAIITDLHIGRGYPDYDGTGYADNGEGEDYYLAERLEKVVNWINENKNKVDCGVTKCPIQFLAVLGDATNTAEKSQFLKVKNILDKLNDPNGDGDIADGIPYVPVFGNHDVWPHTDSEEANSALGEEYFDEIFWDSSSSNFQLIQKFFGDSWKIDEIHKNYKNFAFSYKEMNFIGLDFVSRTPLPEPLGGVGSDAVLDFENEGWLEFRLEEFKGGPTIIFSHHPFVADLTKAFSSGPSPLPNELEQLRAIIEGENIFANFGGHIHGVSFYGLEYLPGFENVLFMNANHEYPSINTTRVVTTESLMVGSNEENPKGVIRIVKVLEPTQISYNNWEISEMDGKTEFIALNPSFHFTFETAPLFPCVFFKAHAFTKRNISYHWDLGDGTTGSGEWETRCYSKAGTYNVTLTVADAKTGEKEYITQKVEVKEGIMPRFLKISEAMAEKIELISTKLGEDLTKIGQVFKDNVLIKVKHSEAKPVGLITVHFGQAAEDIDLTNMIADLEIERRKSILYMSTWPKEIEESKVLFIPSTGIGAVYICPEAISLNEVTPLCPDIVALNLGESKNGMSVAAIQYEGQEYYMIFGIKGTGGDELGITEEIIKNLNDYIQNLPDNAFKNNPRQRKNALKNKLEEVFIKIENKEYQEAIQKLQNDIRAKADGTVGGDPKDDWIIDTKAQNEICTMIDDLITYLMGLL